MDQIVVVVTVLHFLSISGDVSDRTLKVLSQCRSPLHVSDPSA